MGTIVWVIFLGCVAVQSLRRFSLSDRRLEGSNDLSNVSIVMGLAMGVLLVIFLLTLPLGSDSQATYYVNGVVTKGGTNWLLYAGAFLLGGPVCTFLITFLSAIPINLAYLSSKEYRERTKEAPGEVLKTAWLSVILPWVSGVVQVMIRLLLGKIPAFLLSAVVCGIGLYLGLFSLKINAKKDKKVTIIAGIGIALSVLLLLSNLMVMFANR
ncbi:MAG: hypothetical protein LBR25_08955 [Erysipelotrichaceae bacterium]|jgi:hypothetical protein|nr:hypothetical protein [Erysipelotrichaceae bacterium]